MTLDDGEIITVDLVAGVMYIQLNSGEVSRTLDAAPGVNIDLDDQDNVIGVEIFQLRSASDVKHYIEDMLDSNLATK